MHQGTIVLGAVQTHHKTIISALKTMYHIIMDETLTADETLQPEQLWILPLPLLPLTHPLLIPKYRKSGGEGHPALATLDLHHLRILLHHVALLEHL